MAYPSPWPAAGTVARLISEAQRGSTGAVEALLAAYRPALVGFFARRLSYDNAEDLAQAALLRITRALPSIEPDRGDRFIVTIACNLLRTAYVKRAQSNRRWAPEESAELADAPSTVERLAEYEELARAVHRVCAAELSPALQEVVLGLLRGETPAEIATRLKLNPITVRTRLARARTILRRELGRFLDSDDTDPEQLARMTV